MAMTTGIYMTQKKRKDIELAVKLRAEGKITSPGKPFELLNQAEVEALIGKGVFRFEKFEPAKSGGIRIFKSKIVNETKGKATNNSYEKSKLIIQNYSDNGKKMMLTQSPIIQRASQRIILAIAPTLMKQGMVLWLRDITQAYTQSEAPLQRIILADIPEQLQHMYPEGTIMVVVKPLYGIAEAGAHWWSSTSNTTVKRWEWAHLPTTRAC
jgi:hypothetical protein